MSKARARHANGDDSDSDKDAVRASISHRVSSSNVSRSLCDSLCRPVAAANTAAVAARASNRRDDSAPTATPCANQSSREVCSCPLVRLVVHDASLFFVSFRFGTRAEECSWRTTHAAPTRRQAGTRRSIELASTSSRPSCCTRASQRSHERTGRVCYHFSFRCLFSLRFCVEMLLVFVLVDVVLNCLIPTLLMARQSAHAWVPSKLNCAKSTR